MSFFVLLAVACGKEEAWDYRDAWVGDYSYSYHKYSWYPNGSGPDYYGEGTLCVRSDEDSCVIIMFNEDSLSWTCRLDLNGILTLRGNSYRHFDGRFLAPDSLNINCSNFSPGAGTGWEYFCKKIKK